VRIDQKGALRIIEPGVVIDASGDGVVIGACGAAAIEPAGSPRQFAGFSFFAKGIQGPGDLLPIQIPHYLSQAVASGELPHYAKFTNFSPVDETDSGTVSGIVKLSLPPEKDDSDDAARYALAVHAVLQKNLGSYAHARISHMSPCVVRRDGPRLHGAYHLTGTDVLSARKFTDGVVRNAWPIEIWDQRRGPRFDYLDPGQHYEIPLRCLTSVHFDNLLAAGRCISVSARALGSTRVTGPCWTLGEQAGLCAGRILNSDGESL
jgi:hypothetical protein